MSATFGNIGRSTSLGVLKVPKQKLCTRLLLFLSLKLTQNADPMGPFKRYVTQNIDIFDPIPSCHTLLFLVFEHLPFVRPQKVTNSELKRSRENM